MSPFVRISDLNQPGTLINPEAIALHATAFDRTIHLLSLLPGNVTDVLATPMVVVSAFSSEVWLKCLIFIERLTNDPNYQEIINIHDLHKLYLETSDASKKKLQEKWAVFMTEMPDAANFLMSRDGERIGPELERALQAGGDTFLQMRYIYENRRYSSFILFSFRSMVREVVLDLKPEWQNDPRFDPSQFPTPQNQSGPS
jgi:hypothetical protein